MEGGKGPGVRRRGSSAGRRGGLPGTKGIGGGDNQRSGNAIDLSVQKRAEEGGGMRGYIERPIQDKRFLLKRKENLQWPVRLEGGGEQGFLSKVGDGINDYLRVKQ